MGAIASRAGERQASCVMAHAGFSAADGPAARWNASRSLAACSGLRPAFRVPSSSYQPRVVSLSCVPV